MRQTMSLIVGLLLCTTCIVNAQTQMQIEFEKFLALFPSITWEYLPQLTLDNDYIMSCNKLSYEVLRRNMWYEEPQNGPENVYNHIRNEIKSADYGYATPPPHIIDIDGDYIHYEKIGCYGDVYAIGKLEVSNDVILLVVCNKIKSFVYGQREMYTFRKSTQQMISAYVVTDDSDDAYFENDFTFVFFENHRNEQTDDDRITDGRYVHRKTVKLLSDGYFVEKDIQKGLYNYFGYTQDTDGYSNVRKSPNVKSEILYQIKDSSYVDAFGTPDGGWFEVLGVKENGLNNSFSKTKFGGYIHKSRLRSYEKWRKSLRNPDYNN